MKNRRFLDRLGFACKGLATVFRRERSFRTQTALGGIATIVTIAMRLDLLWYALLSLAIGAVLALEAMNAALEYLCDHLHPEHADEIGHVKDAAAGAVLIASFAATTVGALMILTGILSMIPSQP